MAGVKGMKGGGGARPGSGPKPKPSQKTRAKAYQTDDPDEFLRAAMRDSNVPFKDRMAAALALKKNGKGPVPVGKREQLDASAKEVVGRSLAPTPPPSRPRLVAVK